MKSVALQTELADGDSEQHAVAIAFLARRLLNGLQLLPIEPHAPALRAAINDELVNDFLFHGSPVHRTRAFVLRCCLGFQKGVFAVRASWNIIQLTACATRTTTNTRRAEERISDPAHSILLLTRSVGGPTA